MVFKFYIDSENKIILEHFTGNVTLAKIVEAIPHIWDHPDYVPSYNRIADFRNCNLKFSHAEFHMLVESIAEFSERMNGKAAVVVSEPTTAAAGTMYSEKMKEIHSVKIVCSNSEVINYLGIDAGIFEKINDPKAMRVMI